MRRTTFVRVGFGGFIDRAMGFHNNTNLGIEARIVGALILVWRSIWIMLNCARYCAMEILKNSGRVQGKLASDN